MSPRKPKLIKREVFGYRSSIPVAEEIINVKSIKAVITSWRQSKD